jgi:hypothetical protein
MGGGWARRSRRASLLLLLLSLLRPHLHGPPALGQVDGPPLRHGGAAPDGAPSDGGVGRACRFVVWGRGRRERRKKWVRLCSRRRRARLLFCSLRCRRRTTRPRDRSRPRLSLSLSLFLFPRGGYTLQLCGSARSGGRGKNVRCVRLFFGGARGGKRGGAARAAGHHPLSPRLLESLL